MKNSYVLRYALLAAVIFLPLAAMGELGQHESATTPAATAAQPPPAFQWDYEFGPPIKPSEITYADYRAQHAAQAAKTMKLDPAAVADGMDTWHWWVGVDNPGFWQDLTKLTGGVHNFTNLRIDFFRMLMTVPRSERFKKLGLINDPDTVAADKPDQFGLTLDRMKDGTLRWDPDVFGYSSGVIGLQLFKNEKFDPKHWSPEEYLRNPAGFEPPYKVGMACAFCHIGFDPAHPPKNPTEPEWINLSSSIGNQYLREGLIFGLDIQESSLIHQYLAQQEPGTSETSRFPTDSINNPTNINTIVRLLDRLKMAHVEKITPAQATLIKSMYKNAGLALDNIGGALGGTDAEPTIKVPHILTDGADSMGILMASTRVYVNEGMMHKDWYPNWSIDFFDIPGTIRKDFKPSEFDIIGEMRKNPNSPWMQTERRMPNMATFLMSYDSYPLKDAPGGKEYLKAPPSVINQGKIVFADNCAQCHSSKRPDPAVFNKLDPAAKQIAWREIVMKKDFLDHNYLSDDERYSVMELGTNSQRAEGTNAMAGWTWGQMSSQTYKDMRKEQIELADLDSADGKPRPLYNPLTNQYDIRWKGANAFYRTPTLVSIWATAPFLHNNSLGKYTGDPSTQGRMEAFNDAMKQMLWPEKRERVVKVTTAETSAPDLFPQLDSKLQFLQNMRLKILDFPKGTPINLIMNTNPKFVFKLGWAYLKGLFSGEAPAGYDHFLDRRRAAGMLAMKHRMVELSTVPDYVENRGHNYGSKLSDSDKNALIEFVKTF